MRSPAKSSRVRFLLAALFALLAVASAALEPAWATDSMRRSPGSWFYGPQPVWSDGTTTGIFHPMSQAMRADNFVIRPSYEMAQNSGTCKIRPAVQFSHDGVDWDASYPFHATNFPYITTNTISYGTSGTTGFTDMMAIPSSTPKAWVRFGVEVANTSAGAYCTCNAMLRLEQARP